jgi:acylphosphatase
VCGKLAWQTVLKQEAAMKSVRFLVGGRVQGVFFRASTRERAQALELRGFARNLPDGRVEVLAIGDDDAVEELAQWLHYGPSQARVDELERIEAEDDAGIRGFEIR